MQCFHEPVFIRKLQYYEVFKLGFRLTQLQHRTPRRDKKNRLEDILYINLWPLETYFRESTGSGSTRNIKSSKLSSEEYTSLMCKAGLQITTLRLKIRVWVVNASRDR